MQSTIRLKAVRVGLLGVALCVAVSFTALGLWQLDRAAQKHADFLEFEHRGAAPEIVLKQNGVSGAQALQGYRARASGRFTGPTLLLDNQLYRGQAGYLVFSVFALDSASDRLLVNRGWVRAGVDRRRAPPLATPDTNLQLQGRLSDPPETGLRLDGSEHVEYLTEEVWRVQHIDFPVLSSAIGEPLLPVTLLLDENSPAGFVREWLPPGSNEDMHRGYAFQWFALAVTVLIVSVVLTVRSYRAGRR